MWYVIFRVHDRLYQKRNIRIRCSVAVMKDLRHISRVRNRGKQLK